MKKKLLSIRSMKVPFLLFFLILTAHVNSEAITAQDIITKSEYIYPGKTIKSNVTYTFKEQGNPDRIMKMRRFYKNYMGKNGIYSKVLFFYDYPPDIKDVSFMVWAYAGKPEDKWIYLPFLDSVTKLEKDEGADFKGSELKTVDLVPRDPNLDNHKTIKEDKNYYVIESVPLSKNPKYPYSKLIKWIRKDNFTKEKIEYFDLDNKLLKLQEIKWKTMKGALIWDSVHVKNVQNSNETTLVNKDVMVDEEIPDLFFSVDQMKESNY